MAKTKTTSDKTVLAAEKREITGKKVKQLRKKGVLPANISGPGFTSVSITVDNKEFLSAYRVAHETGIVYITLGPDSIPTLVRTVQTHPVSDDILHVDFRKIDLKQKIETTVPVEIVGDSIAVTQLGGVLLKQNENLTVEALPTDIPQHIIVDISSITELDQNIKVSDLPKAAGYEIKDEPETVIVSVIAHKEESVTPETTTEAPEVIGEAPAEGEEGAVEGAAESAPETAPAKDEESK
jgi:large subunit ribosomal protein L25